MSVKRYIPAVSLSAALHLLAVAAVAWPGSRPAVMTDSQPEPIRAFVVAPSEDPNFPGLNPIERTADDWLPDSGGSLPQLSIGKFQADPEKIAARAHVLFPFVSPGVAIDHFFPTMAPNRLLPLENPFAAPRQLRSSQKKPRRPLLLNDSEMQAVVDKSWSRYERWKSFEAIRVLTETHSADEGRLSAVLRKYCDENALQPYADTAIRDPRLWVQLGIAADHTPFIGFIRQYASEHPSANATIELLFLLDKLAQASRDTLAVLLDSEPETRLTWTRQMDPRAYGLIARIRERYMVELKQLGLASKSAIDAHYDNVRLSILRGIITTTRNGYRANDARFLIGAIYWRAERPENAFEFWRELTESSDGSHAVASSQILRLLGNQSTTPSKEMKLDEPVLREVDRILRNDQGRWLMFSYDRLHHFGYRIDTY